MARGSSKGVKWAASWWEANMKLVVARRWQVATFSGGGEGALAPNKVRREGDQFRAVRRREDKAPSCQPNTTATEHGANKQGTLPDRETLEKLVTSATTSTRREKGNNDWQSVRGGGKHG